MHAIRTYFRTMDKWLLLICTGLSGVSVYFLYGLYIAQITNSASRAKTQAVAAAIGIIVAIVISLFDYNALLRLWKLYAPIFVIAVLLTFVIGVERGSNKAWLSIPIMGRSLSIQPSEFLKISFITTFAKHIDYVGKDLNDFRNVVLLAIHGGAHVLLIFIQKDAGTAIVFFGIFLIMIFSAGLSWKYMFAGITAMGLALPIIWSKVMSLDQKMRFLVLKDPSISEQYAYQQLQGLKALGVGGVTGVGFNGKLVYVPESYNDFMFTFIGQTKGMVGCIIVMLVLLFLCIRLVYNANNANDRAGRMLCIGMMALVCIQSIMNIGMCINVLPVIGVPLPFLSAGGTSVVAIYIGVGFCLSVYRFKKKGLFE